MKDNIKLYIAIASFLSAVVIGFIALFIPPMGIIDSSVLWFTSQCLVFCATLLGFTIELDGVKHIAKNTSNVAKQEQEQPTATIEDK